MTPLDRAILALAQHEDALSDQPTPEQYASIEDIRRFPADYARHLAAARAVIEAIREPSEAMTLRVDEAANGHGDYIFRTMIDALLEEH